MIFAQIKRIKTLSMKYSDSDDLDAESLLDLIPKNIPYTKYLSASSLHFDRLRLTTNEEIKFNKKFRLWMKSLVVYGEETNYKYLLDFLIRKYHVHLYNQKELLFITLPFPDYYTNQLDVFKFLSYQTKYSVKYIAECCKKHPDFFYFFLEYFNFISYLRLFLDEIVDFFLSANKHNLHEYADLLKEIIDKLQENDELYLKISKALNFESNVVKNTREMQIKSNVNSNELIYKNKEGRKLLKNFECLKGYFSWLKTTNYKDLEFTDAEYNILDFLMFKSRELRLEDQFTAYKQLTSEIELKYELLKILYTKFGYLCYELDPIIYDFYNKEDILMVMNKYKGEITIDGFEIKDLDILENAMKFKNFNPKIFSGVILSDNLVRGFLAEKNKNDVFTKNLKYFCETHNVFNEYFDNFSAYHGPIVELDINSIIDIPSIIKLYSSDNTIVSKIQNHRVIDSLCKHFGYNTILQYFTPQFVIDYAEKNTVCLDLLKYLLYKFEIEDIIVIIKDYSHLLIHFIENKSFRKMKVIMKELCKTSVRCNYIFSVIAANPKIYCDHFDILSVYDKSYRFINKYKDFLLEYCLYMIDEIDFFIRKTEYDDIRIVNKISYELIEKQKSSILVLFYRYGNVMIPYIDEFVKLFNFDAHKKTTLLHKLDHNVLLQNIVKYNKHEVYEHQIVCILKNKNDINTNVFLQSKQLSGLILFYIIEYNFKNKNDIDNSNFLDLLLQKDSSLFCKLTKYFTSYYKDKYFNNILAEKNYKLINKHFNCFNMDDENIMYDILNDYFDGQDIELEISILSNNMKDVKAYNLQILGNLERSTYRTLRLIYKCIENNKKYTICFKDIYRSILLLLDSKNEEVKKTSRLIYDIVSMG